MNDLSTTCQFVETWLGSNGQYIRINLERKSITIGFSEWFSWHVDTAQMEVTKGVYYFVEPDGNVVGIITMLGYV